jgi:hypothetical protein
MCRRVDSELHPVAGDAKNFDRDTERWEQNLLMAATRQN